MKVKMQLTNIIKEFSGGIEGKVLEMIEQIKIELDFIRIEEILGNLVKSVVTKILEWGAIPVYYQSRKPAIE